MPITGALNRRRTLLGLAGAGAGAAGVAGILAARRLTADEPYAWRFRAEQEHGAGSTGAAVTGDAVYFLDARHLHALDVRTGEVRWRYALGDPSGPPAVADGTVYAGSAESGLHALDAASGTLRRRLAWTADVTMGHTRPVLADGTLYLGGLDTGLRALDTTADGRSREKWHFTSPLSLRGYVRQPPWVTDGTVYVTDDSSGLHALDPATGAARWSTGLGSGSVTPSPVVAAGVVYASTRHAPLRAFDAATGEEIRSYPAESPSPPAVDPGGGLLYVSDAEGLHAFGIGTAERQWTFPAGPTGPHAPALHGGAVWFGTDDGYVHAVDHRTGGEVRSFPTDGAVTGPLLPAPAHGLLCACDDTGTLYALPGGSR